MESSCLNLFEKYPEDAIMNHSLGFLSSKQNKAWSTNPHFYISNPLVIVEQEMGVVLAPFHTYSLDSLVQVISTVSLAFSNCKSGVRIFSTPWGRPGIHRDDFWPPWCCGSNSWQASRLSILPSSALRINPNCLERCCLLCNVLKAD